MADIMKFRNKPVEPKRQVRQGYKSLYNGDDLEVVINEIKKLGGRNLTFHHSEGYYGEHDYEIKYDYDESEERFQQRHAEYIRRLEEYTKWETENHDLIEQEIAKQKEAKKLRDEKQKQRELQDLRKSIEKQQKQLSKLEKKNK